MGILFSFAVVIAIVLIVFAGVRGAGLNYLFAIIIPYLALLTFIIGVTYRVFNWGRSAVPFRVPTTGGQQFTLPWIKSNKLDNPHTSYGVIGRMILEVLLFRSLFRNTKAELHDGPRLVYGSEKLLWLAAIAFHYSFLVILLRHLRFFTVPVPTPIQFLEFVDSFFQVGAPLVYITNFVIVIALLFLLYRRLGMPQIKYISLPSDYFPLFLILAIVLSGIYMRYFDKVDIVGVKQITMGLVSFRPTIPDGIGIIFYIHLTLVCTLFAYFPFSKLVHMAGVFLSPTRNLANNNRMQRHVNPWDYPIKVRSYDDYENEFREKMKKAGIPVEKE
ncbi:MAG: sulfate reduction electron transfer complex DsrMKJOP subunit DsrM [Thermodesulfovibrionales bacterium]|nr:sulfate reduction electron transfer complex DsrMKJOP subunit DsrM [Thermodesulfovibrionales bacterium]